MTEFSLPSSATASNLPLSDDAGALGGGGSPAARPVPRSAFADRPALRIVRPARQTVPIVVASPHSGRDYPSDMRARVELDPATLRSSEDGYVDEVFAGAAEAGAPMIAALFPRAYVDVNREPRELDPAMFDEPLPSGTVTRNARIAAGLGTIARVVANAEPIYDRKLSLAEVEARLNSCYHPYHAALRGLIDETRERFGICILLDAHSMPSAAVAGSRTRGRRTTESDADMVLGDCHGVSCHALVTGHVEGTLERLGYRVRRNNPYAGGFVTRHYGRPERGVHALQIEINRALYMDETRIERAPELPELAGHMGEILDSLARLVPELSLPAQAD